MDPSALGTTIIGLDRIRRDEARYESDAFVDPSPGDHRHLAQRPRLARDRVAQFLRRAADHIAPSPNPA